MKQEQQETLVIDWCRQDITKEEIAEDITRIFNRLGYFSAVIPPMERLCE